MQQATCFYTSPFQPLNIGVTSRWISYSSCNFKIALAVPVLLVDHDDMYYFDSGPRGIRSDMKNTFIVVMIVFR